VAAVDELRGRTDVEQCSVDAGPGGGDVRRQQTVGDLAGDALGKFSQGQVDQELREVDLRRSVHHRVEVDQDGSDPRGDQLVQVEVPVQAAEPLVADVAPSTGRRRHQVRHHRLER